MNIMYCGDRGIEDGVLISALSLARFVPDLNIFILTFDYANDKHHYLPVTEKFRAGLEKVISNQLLLSSTSHFSCFVSLFDITALVQACPPTANQNSRFTPGCMLRLYADHIPRIPDRILYLDNDVVALKDPTPLYTQNLTGHELAGVLDNYGSHFFQLHRGRNYLNSGVLLFNMQAIRATKLFAKARQKCQKEKMFMPDQTALNKLCTTKLILPRRFNEQGKTRSDTVLRHFTTTCKLLPYPHPQTIKPWHIERLHAKLKEHSFDDILQIYQAKIKEIKDE